MTTQTRMQAALAATGIPARRIKCYGSQIMIECASEEAAERFAAVIASVGKVRALWQSWAVSKAADVRETRPKLVKVWMVAGRV